MAPRNQEPQGKRTDRRSLIVAAIVVAVVLVLFLVYEGGFGTAPDTGAGGADEDAIPTQTQETAPESPQ